MRVISGLRKGHRLSAPKGIETRPTEDKVKESLFNILGYIDEEAIILDLFAGSGSIGIEFLSRGAKECYFVDLSPISISTIKENLIHTKLMDQAKVIRTDSIRAIKDFYKKNIKFDYIYLDPPFNNKNLLLNVLRTMAENPILNHGALLIIEHDAQLVLEDNPLEVEKIDERKYGSKRITFFQNA